jgi:hypothetical protein
MYAMRRLLAASVLVVAALPAIALASAKASDPPRAQLNRFACLHSSNSYQRGISVRAVMRAQPYPTRMALRFELLYRAAKANYWSSLQGGDLGRWRHPTNPPTLGQRPHDVWRVTKSVSNLDGRGAYRYRVTFRWTDSQSGKRTQTTLLSRLCRQG